jgi:hypothetical protein
MHDVQRPTQRLGHLLTGCNDFVSSERRLRMEMRGIDRAASTRADYSGGCS